MKSMHGSKRAVLPRNTVGAWVILVALPLAAACSSSSTTSHEDAAGDARLADVGQTADGHHHENGKTDAGAHDATTTDAPRQHETGSRDATHDTAHEAARHDAGKVDAIADATPDTGPYAFFDAGPGCSIGDAGEAVDLKCTGLYSDWTTKTIASDVKPYTPGLQLWSDGALKNRWISFPPGQQIDTSDMDEWTFPVGTRIWKEFNLPTSESDGGLRRIETRLIWKLAEGQQGWYMTTYRWTADGQTDATELLSGQLDANGLGYEVPNVSQGQCTNCHNGRNDNVMGFEAVSLAQPLATIRDAAAMPQLLEAGVLTTPPAPGSLTIPGDPTAAAALGFLHVNCGISCHTQNGAGQGSGLFMRLDVDTLASVQDTWTWTTGWNMAATTYEIPGVPGTDRIQACSLGTSAVYYRADHRDGVDGTPATTQMPPIDSHVVDDAGMAVLGAWINEGCDAGGVDAGADH